MHFIECIYNVNMHFYFQNILVFYENKMYVSTESMVPTISKNDKMNSSFWEIINLIHAIQEGGLIHI